MFFKEYESVQNCRPVLVGHIFQKIEEKYGSQPKLLLWKNVHIKKNYLDCFYAVKYEKNFKQWYQMKTFI